eukprot:gene5478-4771_t
MTVQRSSSKTSNHVAYDPYHAKIIIKLTTGRKGRGQC